MNIDLNTPISKITKLSKEHVIGLKKLKIETILDLLYYLPARYADGRENKNIGGITKGESVTLFGQIKNLKIKRSFRGHVPMCEAKLVDNSGSIKLVWFHQAYIAKMYQEDDFVKISGIVNEKDGFFSMMNPNIERAQVSDAMSQENIFSTSPSPSQGGEESTPIYRETRGVSSNYLNILIKKIILNKEYKILEQLKKSDPVPENILLSLHLPSLEKAFIYIHLPKSQKNIDANDQIKIARKRFAFAEIFFMQIIKQKEKEIAKQSLSYKIDFQNWNSVPPLAPPEGRGKVQNAIRENFNWTLTDKNKYKKLKELALNMRKNPTETESMIWKNIKTNKIGFHFRQQHIINNFIVDFVCLEKRFIIEIDGKIHDYQLESDEERQKILESFDFVILRFTNEEIKNNLENIITKIKSRLSQIKDRSVPLPSGGVGVGLDFISVIEKKHNFKLTNSQNSAIENILNDLNRDEPMGRLLEGDVGSGKTLVAASAAYVVTHDINRDENRKRLQVAYMAPTEILAKQHFESFINYFSSVYGKLGAIEIGLLTSKSCYKFPSKLQNKNHKTNEDNFYTPISKAQLLKSVASGEISILIGTHALISKNVSFNNLAFVIIDEQHRFGVKQRASLANKKSSDTKILVANDLKNLTNKKQKIVIDKNKLPHLLSMTATPIPRTLALTIFGDLDLTVIDEMPKNRKKILTKISNEKDREKIYEEIKNEIKAGYQVYVICPRIDELDEEEMQSKGKLNLRSVESEIKNIEEYFNKKNNSKIIIEGIHSKLKKEEKEKIMEDFSENKIQILVSTSVVEVGVNVPNASRMIIEGAERFGLAQLHQLRGRIGRGERESICYLFTSNGNVNKGSEITAKRLKALETAKNGFELAERDMEERGIGTLQNGKQWGMSDIAMEAIKNLKLVEVARESARKIISSDPDLEKIEHQNLKNILTEMEKVHME